jgi:hypothetical protein
LRSKVYAEYLCVNSIISFLCGKNKISIRHKE